MELKLLVDILKRIVGGESQCGGARGSWGAKSSVYEKFKTFRLGSNTSSKRFLKEI